MACDYILLHYYFWILCALNNCKAQVPNSIEFKYFSSENGIVRGYRDLFDGLIDFIDLKYFPGIMKQDIVL